jgi:hypothetical protein
MAREVFVKLDRHPVAMMRLELTGRGHIPPGTEARGRRLLPFGRPRLADPKDWIEMVIGGMGPKKIGNSVVYRATRVHTVLPF